MVPVSPGALPELAPWFSPERPGPMIYEHVARSGVGQCWVDRWPSPRVVLAELAGNYALRGDPDHVPDLDDVVGLVEAPPEWFPALRASDPAVAVWDRVIATLPSTVEVPPPSIDVRPLAPADADGLAALDPTLTWIGETWGGPAGMAASGRAYGVFVGRRPVSVATSFYVGARHEDIGVVTEPDYRGKGLSTASAAALVADIRARGRTPSWTTSPDNAGSLGVASRLGFVQQRTDVLYAVRSPIPTN